MHGSAQNVFEYGFEPGTGHRPYFVTRPVALWLQAQLHFPNWTTADIIARCRRQKSVSGPRRERVLIEPAYDTELREAGVRALGSGFPGLTRQQLTAVPIAEWEREKDRFVYEKWIEHARAAAGK